MHRQHLCNESPLILKIKLFIKNFDGNGIVHLAIDSAKFQGLKNLEMDFKNAFILFVKWKIWYLNSFTNQQKKVDAGNFFIVCWFW